MKTIFKWSHKCVHIAVERITIESRSDTNENQATWCAEYGQMENDLPLGAYRHLRQRLKHAHATRKIFSPPTQAAHRHSPHNSFSKQMRNNFGNFTMAKMISLLQQYFCIIAKAKAVYKWVYMYSYCVVYSSWVSVCLCGLFGMIMYCERSMTYYITHKWKFQHSACLCMRFGRAFQS